ncbi:tyrosine-type recombinase/integrase [Winogradskyella poriferorum]|uniref:tyrosine-type recombinase/integrase n=1 Tax=Winogradskyella poriferorum TaxID=307627 RepID=UPI003D65B16F
MSVKLRERKLAKGAVKFYLDIYHNQERTYEFLDIKITPSDTKEAKAEKKKIANLIRSNKELELITEDTNYIPKHLKNIRYSDYADSYIKSYKKRDIRMIEATDKRFRSYIKNERFKLSDFNPAIIKGYMDYLNDESGLTGDSPHNYFTRFKKIIKSAIDQNLMKANPFKNIRFKKKNNQDELRKQVLNTEELQKLSLTYCGNEELKKAFLFACYTGLGYAEIKELTWANVANGKLITRRAKTNQKVEIKLKDSLIKLLGKPKGIKDLIFDMTSKNGKTISDNGVNKCLKNWVGRAKIDKHITFYCARHTFATQLLTYGANLKTVADALGHTNTRNTIKYLNYIDSLKDEAVDKLPDLIL